MSPGAASGTDWVNPNRALVTDTLAAVFPADTLPAEWLKVTDFSDHSFDADFIPLGFEVNIDVIGTGGPTGTGHGCLVYAANATDCTDDASDAHDTDDGTYYGYSATVIGDCALTIVHDLGTAHQVTDVRTIGYNVVGDPRNDRAWHYSHDGSTWSACSFTSSPPAVTPSVAWEFDAELSSPVTARYWRLTIRDRPVVGVDGPGPGGPRAYEFELFDGAVRVDHTTTSTFERLEVSLTVDGSTPVGDTRVFSIDPGGGSAVLGGISDLWGYGWTIPEIDSGTFGVLVRRADVLGDEATTTDRRVDGVSVSFYYDTPLGSLEMPREAPLQLSILGKETTPGTPVTPTIRLKAGKVMMNPDEKTQEFSFQGDLIPGLQQNITNASQGSIEGVPTYDELGLFLASVCGKPVTSVVSTGVYRHEFTLDVRGQADPQAYTHQYGDKNFAEQFAYMLVSGLGVKCKRNEAPSISGSAIARNMVDGQTLAAGVACVQTMTITGVPTGGTYKLRFKGAETGAIAYNADASAIQTALQALSTVGASNLLVSGTGPFVFTFAAALAGTPQPLVELSNNSLTGGSSPTATIAMTTQGGYTEFACVPMNPGEFSVYYSATQAGLVAGKLTDCFSAEFEVGNRFAQVWVLDDTLDSFKLATESPMTLTAKVNVQADALAATMAAAKRAQSDGYVRLEATSKVNIPTTAVPYKFTIDMFAKVAQIGSTSVEGEIYAREFSMSARFDGTWGRAIQISLVNGTPSY